MLDNAKLRDNFSLRGILKKKNTRFSCTCSPIVTGYRDTAPIEGKTKCDVGETQFPMAIDSHLQTKRISDGDPCTRAGWGEDIEGGIRKSNMTG